MKSKRVGHSVTIPGGMGEIRFTIQNMKHVKKLLVVHGDAKARRQLTLLLAGVGFDVRVAETVDEALTCLAVPGLTSLQFIFNLFRQKAVDALLPQVKAKGVAFVVRLPLASGLLASKYSAATTFAESDHRNFNRDGQAFNVGETFAGLPFVRGVALVEELREFVPPAMAMADFALRWCLDHDAVTAIIPGARNPAQVRGNVHASELAPLPPALHAKLREFYAAQVAPHIRGAY